MNNNMYEDEVSAFRKLHADTVKQLEQDFQKMFEGVLFENVSLETEMLQET